MNITSPQFYLDDVVIIIILVLIFIFFGLFEPSHKRSGLGPQSLDLLVGEGRGGELLGTALLSGPHEHGLLFHDVGVVQVLQYHGEETSQVGPVDLSWLFTKARAGGEAGWGFRVQR